jgi:hypothetical protein
MAADANTLILLPLLGDTVEKGKNEPTKFSPARPSKSVFRNPMHRRAFTKAAGWKWG